MTAIKKINSQEELQTDGIIDSFLFLRKNLLIEKHNLTASAIEEAVKIYFMELAIKGGSESDMRQIKILDQMITTMFNLEKDKKSQKNTNDFNTLN